MFQLVNFLPSTMTNPNSERTMSKPQSPLHLHVHEHHHHHHHISVGLGTMVSGLLGLGFVIFAGLNLALIQNPQSLRVFLETFVRPQLEPAGPRPSGDFENLQQPKTP